MGWIALLLIGAATFGALLWLRVPRLLWTSVGAALMVGATGYALQGRPTLPAAPATGGARALAADPALIDLRTAMFGRYGAEGAFLIASDAMARSGSAGFEVRVLLGAIQANPRSVPLWTALGDALARHDRGQLSAPARIAFEQAIRLDPRQPGPWFFLGVSQVRSRDFTGAERSWRNALARTAPNASYRPALVERLAFLDQLRAMVER